MHNAEEFIDIVEPVTQGALEQQVRQGLNALACGGPVIPNFISSVNVGLVALPSTLLPTIAYLPSFCIFGEASLKSDESQSAYDCRRIPRHYGKIKEANPSQPVYCLFIAPKLSAGLVAHFFNLNRFNTKLYGGQTSILPLSLGQFRQVVARAREKKFDQPAHLEKLVKGLVEMGRKCEDEDVWLQAVQLGVNDWLQD